MRRGLAPLLLASITLIAAEGGRAEDDYGGLPAGPGREETYGLCSACHSIRLVTQQRLTRQDWDETLVWMVAEQEMDEIEPAERDLVLDYLSTYFGRDVPR